MAQEAPEAPASQSAPEQSESQEPEAPEATEPATQNADEQQQSEQEYTPEYVQGLRSEAARWRTKFREAERGNLPEAERIQAENNDLKNELQTLKRDKLVAELGARYKAKKPGMLAAHLADDVLDDPTAAERAIKQLKQEAPFMFEDAVPSGGQINPAPRQGGDMDSIIRGARS